MGNFWCYLAFILGGLCLFVGLAGLAQGLTIMLIVLTVVCAFISVVVESQASEKNAIAFVLSALAIALAVVGGYLGFYGSQMRTEQKLDTTQMRMHELGEALERFRHDRGVYPPWASGSANINYYLIPERSGWPVLPSFRTWVMPGDENRYRLLTTPVAYLPKLPADPYMQPTSATFAYYADSGGWILLSPGPDQDFDINPQQLYSSTQPQPSPLLSARRYDPTNGARSDGDVFLVSQQKK